MNYLIAASYTSDHGPYLCWFTTISDSECLYAIVWPRSIGSSIQILNIKEEAAYFILEARLEGTYSSHFDGCSYLHFILA
ncbi:hypothetical protein BVRB_5g099350 [Beta vulgaris subsp. vulgaris]|nr:hypothetical protein BVRB_5g099350 [Beta vulgaris subsp. vulgaris]